MDGDSNRRQASPPGRSLVRGFACRHLGPRRLLVAVANRFTNRRFVFSFTAVSVLAAKSVHIYAHHSALPTVHVALWGYSFFAQDMALLVFVRLLLDGALLAAAAWLRLLATFLAAIVVTYVATLSTINVSFFVAAGSEIHWRNVGFAGDAASRALLLTGLFSLLLVLLAFVLVAWAFQDVAYGLAGCATDIFKLPFTYQRIWAPHPAKYSELPQHDVEGGKHEDQERRDRRKCMRTDMKTWPWLLIWRVVLYALVGAALLAQVIFLALRPHESALTFMSWTPALLPFVDFKNSSPNLEKIAPVYGSGIGRDWDNRTALADPTPLPWLPNGTVLPGFEDWKRGKRHYNAASDPLKVSNLDEELLEELRGKLGDVPIRHVVVILLESTRKDVFPIKKDGFIWKRFEESFENKTLPEAARRRLATLSPTAKSITGDYDDGFTRDEKDKRPRGGINFNNAYSTSTYTIKSMAGTLCGISPLVADFNLEYRHHIYQPCLPQVLDTLNALDGPSGHNFTTHKWRSTYLTSVILYYDKLELLLSSMGYPEENLIGKEYLKSAAAKFGPVTLPDINYFGMAETCLEDYIRDAFASARKKDERVFLTHLTSTSHHPFAMPPDEEYVPLGKGLDDLSHYVNSIGFEDKWIGKILGTLEDEGVADETLVVFAGDHGLSLAENGKLPTYYNPNSISNHIPLVLSHPKLPPVTVDAAVSSLQVLPTILDLLRETGSLSDAASKAAGDLMNNYEGQSLVRPMRSDNKTGPEGSLGDWQFTVVNPGSALLSVRDARSTYAAWRLVVPVVDNVEWRFTDLDEDPAEGSPTVGFDFKAFLKNVEERHGERAARWAEEGAFVSRWWVEENSKRWRYGPYGD
ncbi:sulfatase domain-containingprotein [Purpureocillium lavendulum]|uniref:Sulfatase domain-containingprotein n=1 Tax=Purpureocillium lavendulum TaxID=1247861 RepID=A0AB34FUM6_9HYPO|nr:sulfatase domain-containingprotein [Purpureocillium lavendulum]